MLEELEGEKNHLGETFSVFQCDFQEVRHQIKLEQKWPNEGTGKLEREKVTRVELFLDFGL